MIPLMFSQIRRISNMNRVCLKSRALLKREFKKQRGILLKYRMPKRFKVEKITACVRPACAFIFELSTDSKAQQPDTIMASLLIASHPSAAAKLNQLAILQCGNFFNSFNSVPYSPGLSQMAG